MHTPELTIDGCDSDEIGLTGAKSKHAFAGFCLDLVGWAICGLVRDSDFDLAGNQVDVGIFAFNQFEQRLAVQRDVDTIIGHTHKALGPWADKIDPGMRGASGFLNQWMVVFDRGPAS